MSAGPSVRIGPYRILRKLGEGGVGVVYEALQRGRNPFTRAELDRMLMP